MENLFNMILIDFLDHRIIALIVCSFIIIISIISIIIRFIFHNKKYKKDKENDKNE